MIINKAKMHKRYEKAISKFNQISNEPSKRVHLEIFKDSKL